MMKTHDNDRTVLKAETIDDVVELEKLERMLLHVGCSPQISVANWSQHPDTTHWRTDKLQYRTSFMDELYDLVVKYK